jgi:hypothetical protein
LRCRTSRYARNDAVLSQGGLPEKLSRVRRSWVRRRTSASARSEWP